MEDDNLTFGDERTDYRDRRSDKRDRGGRRRDRKPRIRKDRERHDSQGNSEGNDTGENSGMKTPIILAKKSQSQGFISDSQKKENTPTWNILGIQRRSGTSTQPSSGNTSTSKTYSDGGPSNQRYNKYENKSNDTSSPSTPIQPQATSHVEQYALTGIAALKIPDEAYLSESISVIDGSFQWSDRAFESLLDQTDYVVVGCVGMQGSGKSTLMSLLAGQKIDQIEKTRLVFRPQKKSDIEKCIHRTVGVDIYVTRERMILLDTQPLMSPSMLEQYLKYDRKVPSEYSTAEICLEVQALQLITFLYTVCHVVLVVQDHMLDLNLLNLLKTSEMLKPSTVSHGNQDNSSNSEDMSNEFFPHLVFVYTCCDARSFESDVIRSMCEITWKLFEHSRLHVKGSASMLRAPILPVNRSELLQDYQDVNIFFLPTISSSIGNDDEDFSPIAKYQGHPSLGTLVRIMRQQLSSMPRVPFTHHVLSEKNWFHYSARTWEAVKKSNLIAEYHRLLTT